MKEQDLLKSCLRYLELRGFLCWRQNQGAIAGEYKGKRRFVKFTTAKGISDIIGILPGGRFLAVECKIRPNKPTFDQECFLEQIRKAGGLAVVVYEVTDLIKALEAI
jgi:hypothetical protein